jgi:DNA polymerase-3 subunit alpha
MDDTDKLKVLIEDAKQFDVAFEPPDVNRGNYRFEPVDDKTVRYGLGAIKGTGQSAIEAIVAAREGAAGQGGGPFHSLFDFCARVDRQRINKRVVEALIKSGAFDKLHPDRAAGGAGSSQAADVPSGGRAEGAGGRAQLLASVSLALDWADTQAAHADQVGLFDFGDSHAASTHEPALVAAAPWDVKERLMQEKAALGFFLSGHLFEQSEAEVRRFCRTRIADLADSREPQLLAGIAGDLRVVNGQRGRVMIFQLDDRSEVIEAVANEEVIDAHRELLREDELLIVQGRVKLDRFSNGLRLDVAQVWDLAGARARFGRYLAVAVNGIPLPLQELLRQWPARKRHTEQGDLAQGLPVRLQLRRSDAAADLDLGDDARFWPCDEALERWRSVAHQGQASIVYG